MVVLEPHERVVADELAHLGAAVVGAGVAPRRLRAPVVVEVDAAAVVLAPAVEPPQVEVGRAEVVVDHVEDDREAAPRGPPRTKSLKPVRPAVGALDGEDVRGVVAPGAVAGELGDRHDCDGVHAEPLQVVEPADASSKVAGWSPSAWLNVPTCNS